MSLTRNLSVVEAAEFLGCKVRYLEDNLSKLPHQKMGISVAFDEDELAEIKAMHRVRPTPAAASTAPPALAQIRPRGQRRTG